MYLIAICDDEQTELDKTTKVLNDYRLEWFEREYSKLDCEIKRYTSAEELIRSVREDNYVPDLILMDIYMQGMTGIEAAKVLRDMEIESRIIFLTTSREHALDAFRVDATQYLTKPVMSKQLYSLLDRLFADAATEKKYIVVQADKRACRVAAHDIVYCEAQRKNQHMYLSDGTQLCLHMSMAGLEELLSAYREIVRVGNSYIVNLRHIEGLNGQELQMDTGKKLYVSRGSYQSLREQYFGYYTEVSP